MYFTKTQRVWLKDFLSIYFYLKKTCFFFSPVFHGDILFFFPDFWICSCTVSKKVMGPVDVDEAEHACFRAWQCSSLCDMLIISAI